MWSMERVERMQTLALQCGGTEVVSRIGSLIETLNSLKARNRGMEKRGVRFHPTDTEGLTFLKKFMAKQEMNDSGFITTNIDVYDSEEEPWKIYSRGVPCGDADDSLFRYFITKKSSNLGNWKLQSEGKPVHRDSSSSTVVMGCKKKMCYMINNNEELREDDGHYWMMKEYELSNVILHQFDDDRRDYVLWAIKKKFIETCFSEMENVSEEFGAIQV
ncbi:hypothetical protein CQW23_26622 [Capsicum baccatum]|uniref:NAC domain-containing protein n=1 Tax=Capsicum baccatum TaxID=33114 RepID=A0A2G2VPC9_CAPBA|nr:hypothetical protein CQW23_26622 [Capsicum baccatum]